MKNICRYTAIFAAAAVLVLFAFAGCSTFEVPPSKEVTTSSYTKLFQNTKFNNAGMSPMQLVINRDLSGYMVYYCSGTTVEQKTNAINTAIQDINKSAYSEADYNEGYRALYVNPKNIEQYDETTVTVKVEFVNINYLKTSDIKIQTLEEYLSDSTNYSRENNNFYKDAKTHSTVSIMNIKNKDTTYIATYLNVVNQTPVTITGARIVSYDGNYVSLTDDTIKFSSGNNYFIFVQSQFPVWLIIVTCSLEAVFVVLIGIKIIQSQKRSYKK